MGRPVRRGGHRPRPRTSSAPIMITGRTGTRCAAIISNVRANALPPHPSPQPPPGSYPRIGSQSNDPLHQMTAIAVWCDADRRASGRCEESRGLRDIVPAASGLPVAQRRVPLRCRVCHDGARPLQRGSTEGERQTRSIPACPVLARQLYSGMHPCLLPIVCPVPLQMLYFSIVRLRHLQLMDICTPAGVLSGDDRGGRRGGRQPRQRRQQRAAVGRQGAPHATARLQGMHSTTESNVADSCSIQSRHLPWALGADQWWKGKHYMHMLEARR